MRYIVADCETTGLTRQDRIVELAWQELDGEGRVIDQVHSLIDPQMPIPRAASDVHGITNAKVVHAPTLQEFFSQVAQDPFRDGAVMFIAHNARFDLPHFRPFIRQLAGIACTLKAARLYFPEAPNHKLTTLKEYLELSQTVAHSADGDVATTVELLGKLVAVSYKSLPELCNALAAPQRIDKMPFGKHKGRPLAEVPKDYIHWLLGQPDLDPDLKYSFQSL